MLLLLGVLGIFVPRIRVHFLTLGLCGGGALLCLPVLLWRAATAMMELPIGPPGLSIRLTLDPLSAFFMLTVFVCGTALTAFAAVADIAGSAHSPPVASVRQGGEAAIPLCLAGLLLFLLASDPVTLATGLSLSLASFPASTMKVAAWRMPAVWPAFVLLFAVCLLAPLGFVPRFEAIRALAVDPGRATGAAVLGVGGSLGLVWRKGPWRRQGEVSSDPTPWRLAQEALAAGAMIPAAIYAMMRLVLDLPGPAAQAWWGFVLLLLGGAIAVSCAWRAAEHPDLGVAVGCLAHRQAGLAIVGLGLALVARSADLPDAASLGLAATLLLTIASGAAGTLASLASHAMIDGAGTGRLARLGGLVHSMPIACIALSAALLAESALPPGAGFAALWLLLQSTLLAPRTGGLLSQLLLGLTVAALALSSALATVAAVRLIGVAVLGRPRSVRGSAARDVGSLVRPVLLALSGIAMLIGALPGLVLKALADPVIQALTKTDLEARAGWAMLSPAAASPGYAPLSVLALLALATGSISLVVRRTIRNRRSTPVWNDGIPPSADLPFGNPATQSAGTGFLPTLPDLGWVRWPVMRNYPSFRFPSAAAGLWAVLVAVAALLVVLSVFDGVRQ